MSKSHPPKWKILENVVAAIERSLNAVAGTRVVPNALIPERISGARRQVDVYVEIPTGRRTLRIAIEVRDKVSPLDLPEVEQLVAKLKKLDVDYGCIVSRSGFTVPAEAEAGRSGIELRTIAQIEHPNWWLASSMMVDLRQVELLEWQINFRTDELPRINELLAGIPGTALELTLGNGETGTLPTFISARGTEAINRPELSHLNDQDTFIARIEFGELQSATLKCPRGPLPLPQSVVALYRLHHRVEWVKLSAYQQEDRINAFTGLSHHWGRQMTLVTELQPDGSRHLSFTSDDPSPMKTKISLRKIGPS